MSVTISERNIHATAIVVGDKGLAILGPSGSGKTTLAAALVDHFTRHGRFSRLVGDDQLFVEVRDGRLVARAPAAIAGLTEVPGLGPCPAPFESAAVIDLVLRLLPAGDMQRFQEEAVETIAGLSLPLIHLAGRSVTASLPTVAAGLRNLPPRAG